VAYLKSENNSSIFISQRYEQGGLENDWISYTPSLEITGPSIDVLSGSTATLLKTGTIVENDAAILVQEGSSTTIHSGTIDGFIEKTWDGI